MGCLNRWDMDGWRGEGEGASPPPSPPGGGREMPAGEAGASETSGIETGLPVVLDGVYDWGCIHRWARQRGNGYLMERWTAQMSEDDRRKARGLRFDQEYQEFKLNPTKFVVDTFSAFVEHLEHLECVCVSEYS